MSSKRTVKRIIAVILALILLAGVAILVARFAFGYDIFDRSGWCVANDGSKRYLDYHGYPVLGWQTVDGMTYYFDPQAEGDMRTGWLRDGNDTYYLDDAGQKIIGAIVLDNERYYFDVNGCMQTGWLIDGTVCRYFDADGKMQTGWLELQEGDYYLDDDGIMQTGWLDLPEGRFCLGEDGKMLTGWLETEQGLYQCRSDRP